MLSHDSEIDDKLANLNLKKRKTENDVNIMDWKEKLKMVQDGCVLLIFNYHGD